MVLRDEEMFSPIEWSMLDDKMQNNSITNQRMWVQSYIQGFFGQLYAIDYDVA